MDVEGSCTDDFTGDRHVVEDRKMGIRHKSVENQASLGLVVKEQLV